MKFRRMREVYWLEAITSATRVIENVTPTTVIIEKAQAIVDNIPRAPSALAPNRRGRRTSHWALPGRMRFDQSHREGDAARHNQRRHKPKAPPTALFQNRLS